MSDYTRFAVYFAPRDGAFADFCAAWLGWDARGGSYVAHPDIEGLRLPVSEITATPRKYGFHGTIKPPFRLADGTDVVGLQAQVAALAAGIAPVTCDGLHLHQLGRFLALTPKGDTTELAALAARVVKELDHFRAPATDAELAKRRGRGLTSEQDANLVAWGYPYVLDAFQFHLTMSGQLDKAEVALVANALTPHLAPLLPQPFVVENLCLFGEADDGRFHLLHRYALTG